MVYSLLTHYILVALKNSEPAGRLMSRATDVHVRTSHLLGTKFLKQEPLWYRPVLERPPSMDIARRPYPRRPNLSRRERFGSRPPKITYLQDRLRKQFFQKHPWELARPYLVAEGDGKDLLAHDWSRLEQPNIALTGEW